MDDEWAAITYLSVWREREDVLGFCICEVPRGGPRLSVVEYCNRRKGGGGERRRRRGDHYVRKAWYKWTD